MTCAGFHVLVPLKACSAAKSRLASRLDRAARARLVRRMLGNVIDACRAARHVHDVRVLVAGDLAPVARVVPDGVVLVPEAHRAGLRAGLADVLDGLNLDGPGRPGIAIVMADLPALTGAALDRVLAPTPAMAGLVAADQHGSGTSLLAWRGTRFRDFRYGPGSFEAHGLALTEAGLCTQALEPEPAFHDIDTFDDLERLAALDTEQSAPMRFGIAA